MTKSQRCSAIKPTAVEAAFRTKLTTLPMIPG